MLLLIKYFIYILFTTHQSDSFVGLMFGSIKWNQSDYGASADRAGVFLFFQLFAAVLAHTQMTTGHNNSVLFLTQAHQTLLALGVFRDPLNAVTRGFSDHYGLLLL